MPVEPFRLTAARFIKPYLPKPPVCPPDPPPTWLDRVTCDYLAGRINFEELESRLYERLADETIDEPVSNPSEQERKQARTRSDLRRQHVVGGGESSRNPKSANHRAHLSARKI
jgi:hypothetical protein